MSSSFPAQVLQQAQYDARVGGQGMDRNPFQRAQDFLRNKLQPAINPATATPAQQTDIDARNAKKAIEELQRAKTVKQLGQLRQSTIGQGLGYGSMVLGALSGAYNAGKNPYGGMASIVETDLSSAIKPKNTSDSKSSDLRGSITPGSSQPAASNLGEGAAMDAAERSRAGAGFPAGVTRPSDYPISSSTKKITSEDSELSSTPTYNAKERVEKYGVKKAEDMAMMEWAKAHKGLAEKVKPGQAGYDAIQLALGKTTVEPEDIRGFMDDSGKSAEEARAILGGGSVETVIDGDKPMVTTINQAPAPDNQKGAETFKNFAIGALQGLDIGKYKDLGYNPFQIDAGKLLDQSVDFNVPGLEGTLGNYGAADYGELLKKYPNVFSYK